MPEVEYPKHGRMSILPPLVLAKVKAHPEASKADLTELIFGDRVKKKSSLDKPLALLLNLELVDAIVIEGNKKKLGEGRTHYRITQKGLLWLK